MKILNLEARRILTLLPHRYPFLLVDRVEEIDPERAYIRAVKNVSHNEPFFLGHFPGNPIMPGVLIIEAMAQTGGIYIKVVMEDCRDKLFVFAGIDRARFRRPVLPGDTLVIEAEGFKRRGHVIKSTARATVNGKLAAEAEITAAMVEEENA
ncbi:MAG TPA: 3-hydroxyacyl-ACP dehydratase FabZ [Thermosulfurimonas dismutans]|uniref:3-hydroxyacyl-[acyl-carrier-protein] dehydratase FabZ n=1 Tax=Thermosulfurimonas dismutans TaxID=999894 RepID=A0A7C3GDG1_9BACT|nr:3-hydroxyacyl-ACP dehydratase FabZ [Thermosulfurimonas sp.]HFC97457.1 3-hydroxyacyl-ACP dehydratase FabZ [Thermosulfurimonas dismutans]